MSVRHVDKGATIIRQGDATDQVYFVLSGHCRVLKTTGLSRRQQVLIGLRSNDRWNRG